MIFSLGEDFMVKRILIIAGFVVFFALMVCILFYLQKKGRQDETQALAPIVVQEKTVAADGLHTYSAADLSAECSGEDNIFCAVERAVKCTITPELTGCDKDNVPAFVIGKAEDTERPTEVSFKITKIKPVPDSQDISVYTESDCNAMWFGLCKGTVVYSLSPRESDGQWRVTNIFALE